MKKNGLKIMKTAHLLTASAWFGGLLFICAIVAFSHDFAQEMFFPTLLNLIPFLYRTVILPAGILIILQGIIYGFFTQWGFFRLFWIRIKWLLIPIIGLATGIGGVNAVYTTLDIYYDMGYKAALASMDIILIYLVIQLACLMFMMGLSVYKPLASGVKN